MQSAARYCFFVVSDSLISLVTSFRMLFYFSVCLEGLTYEWAPDVEWSDSIRNGVTWYTLLHFLCRSLLAFFVHWFQPACNAFCVCVCVCQCWCWAVFNLGEEKMQSTWRHAGWPAVSLGYWMLHLMMVPVSTCAETYFLHVLRTNQICCCCCS